MTTTTPGKALRRKLRSRLARSGPAGLLLLISTAGLDCGRAPIQSEIEAEAGDILRLGSTRRLFIDTGWVESSPGLQQRFHTPERHPANPILEGDREWEKWTVEVDGRPTHYDPESGMFRMWYLAPLLDPAAPSGIRYQGAYAESGDGVRWRRPHLGLVDRNGSRENNLIPRGENWMRRINVIEDERDPDPSRRFKMMYVDVLGGQTAITKAHSADGIQWRLNADGKPWFRKSHNGNLMGWDDSLRRYVYYVRMPGSPNSVGRSTSSDFVDWSEPVTVLAPGSGEPHTHFKGLAAFRYQDLYLGWIWVFRDEPGGEGMTSAAELAWSRDGIDWQRNSPGRPLFPGGEPGSWDSEMILVNAPVVARDRIWIYYTGQNFPYAGELLERVQAGWKEGERRLQRAIGLATLRLDGFASMSAGTQQGVLTTKPFRAGGRELRLNADVRGELRVEVLGPGGDPLEGFSSNDCRVISGDSLSHRVEWTGGELPGAPQDQPLRLRFLMRDADLYSVWCERLDSGAAARLGERPLRGAP